MSDMESLAGSKRLRLSRNNGNNNAAAAANQGPAKRSRTQRIRFSNNFLVRPYNKTNMPAAVANNSENSTRHLKPEGVAAAGPVTDVVPTASRIPNRLYASLSHDAILEKGRLDEYVAEHANSFPNDTPGFLKRIFIEIHRTVKDYLVSKLVRAMYVRIYMDDISAKDYDQLQIAFKVNVVEQLYNTQSVSEKARAYLPGIAANMMRSMHLQVPHSLDENMWRVFRAIDHFVPVERDAESNEEIKRAFYDGYQRGLQKTFEELEAIARERAVRSGGGRRSTRRRRATRRRKGLLAYRK